jgi:phthalate 4,5-cis-dihydrodiol dehydrogenase
MAKTNRALRLVAELNEMYDAIVAERAPFHDGAWGLATLEVCFGILESARSGKEVTMTRQVAIGDEA